MKKEEPKQEVKLKDPNTCEHFKEVGCIKDICTCYTLVPKQETLEEREWLPIFKEYAKDNECNLYTFFNWLETNYNSPTKK